MRRDNEVVQPEDFVYQRVERCDEAETWHKIAPISKGPYLVTSVDKQSKTVVIEYDDRAVEKVSRSRLVLAPRRMTPEKIQEVMPPALISETILDYSDPEKINQRHVGSKT